MAYTINIPFTGETLGQSRLQVLNNFNLIYSGFDVNHYSFNEANIGKHRYVVMPQVVGAPGTTATEGALFTNAVSGITQLFWQPPNNATGVQLTALDQTNGNFAAVGNGWTFLPGGLIMQYGVVNTPGTSGSVNFPIAFSSGVYSVFMSISRTSNTTPLTYWLSTSPGVTLSTFTYGSSAISGSAPVQLFWWALGK